MLQPPPVLDLGGEIDEYFKNAVELVVHYDRASPALLQRRLSIGYARAARVIDQLEAAGVVGPAEGAKPRDVLIHSAEEVFSKQPKKEKPKQDDPFEAPADYKVPKDVKLTRAENSPWGMQFSEVIGTKDFRDSQTEFPLLLGIDDNRKLHTESLRNIGNLIIAGNTLSQKENLLDTILLNYLLRYSPQELRLVLNDESHYLDLYNGVPHLLSPVINDYSKALSALKWSVYEMQARMKAFSEAAVREIGSYQKLPDGKAIPYILIVTCLSFIDNEIEDALIMLTEQGLRSGIHNIVVVNRANGESLPQSLKSNIPARVVFRMSSAGESRAIDVSGADTLEPGKLIYKPNYGSTAKLKAVFTPEVNVKEVVEAIKSIM